MSLSNLFGIVLLGVWASLGLAYPTSQSSSNLTIFKDPESGLKYFWHPDQNGKLNKAFLEGGPLPVIQATEDDVHFFFYPKYNLINLHNLIEFVFFNSYFIHRNNPVSHELKPNCPSCIDGKGFDPNAPIKFVCHGLILCFIVFLVCIFSLWLTFFALFIGL